MWHVACLLTCRTLPFRHHATLFVSCLPRPLRPRHFVHSCHCFIFFASCCSFRIALFVSHALLRQLCSPLRIVHTTRPCLVSPMNTAHILLTSPALHMVLFCTRRSCCSRDPACGSDLRRCAPLMPRATTARDMPCATTAHHTHVVTNHGLFVLLATSALPIRSHSV